VLSVLIVGCGNVAGGFDRALPPDAWPATHAGAYRRDGRFELVACVEPDEERRADFMATWSIGEGFRTTREVVEAGMTFDVVSICSPTTYHASDLELALSLKPKAVLCEKPATPSVDESERLVKLFIDAGVPLAINYNRRWDPEINQLRAQIAQGEWGALRSATAVYNKGVLNNGSHMIDLLEHLFGHIEVVGSGEQIADYFENDPTVPAWLVEPSGAPIYLTCGHAADYSIFELNLVFADGTVAIEDGGENWRVRRVIASERFAGYCVLDTAEYHRGGDEQTMSRAVDNIYRTVAAGAPLASTGTTALRAQKICDQIRTQAVGRDAKELERVVE
jgi:predicted dehydrogenase